MSGKNKADDHGCKPGDIYCSEGSKKLSKRKDMVTKGDSLETAFMDEAREAISKCTQCGACVSGCKLFPYYEIKDVPPEKVVEALHNMITKKAFSDIAYTFATECQWCHTCVSECPEGLDPSLLNTVIKNMIRSKQFGEQVPTWGQADFPLQYKRLMKLLARIQMKPGDERWLWEVPENPKQTDVVVFLGCSGIMKPHEMFVLDDILRGMDLDYTMLVGGNDRCCGLDDYIYSGDFGNVEKLGDKLIRDLEVFEPKLVLTDCIACYITFSRYWPQYRDMSFKTQHTTEYLAQNLEKLDFSRSIDEKVSVFNGCNTDALGLGYGDWIRTLLAAIPGVELVEMNREGLCCGEPYMNTSLDLANEHRSRTLNKVKATGVDTVVTICRSCGPMLATNEEGLTAKFEDYMRFMGRALGVKYEDKLKKYLRYRDVDKVLDEAREYIDANNLTAEDIAIIREYFSESASTGLCSL